MKIDLGDGLVIDTADHRCERFSRPAGQPCVFCEMNATIVMQGQYAIPFDIPGAYDKTERPNVKIIKLPQP